MNSYWAKELWRIALVLFLALLGGMLSGLWQISICVVLIGYIAWILHKLQQLHNWLSTGGKRRNTPDSDGIWEAVGHQIQNIQNKSNRRKTRMAKSLKRSRGIITSLPYATVILNENNEIDWANETAEQLLRISKRKDQGQRIDNLVRVPEFTKILSSKESKEIEMDAPREGHEKLAIQLIPVKSDLKLLIARDISDRIHIQEMRKHFIANASHELSTPLTVIRGYLELITIDDHLPDHLQKASKNAYEQSARMQKIIEELLQLSRLERSDMIERGNIEIDMTSLLSSICAEETALIVQQTHRFETDLDEHLTLKGSEAEIFSLCSNLIHNAIRHTPPGTLIKVHWRTSPGDEACLIVEDNGLGIAAEDLPHLTERFYRADKGRSDTKGGTGLGLAIVQHIVQRHNGKLDIRSTLGKGTVFKVCFPADRVVISCGK